MHDDCKLPRTMPASHLARWLRACLHGVYKLPCTTAASYLAWGLQATLHDGCKPLGKVFPPRRGRCFPRCGEGASLGAGKVLPPVQGRCLPRGGEGASLSVGKWISHVELILGYRHTEIIRCPIDSPKHDSSKTKPLHPGNGQGGFRTDASTRTMRGRRGEGDQSWW